MNIPICPIISKFSNEGEYLRYPCNNECAWYSIQPPETYGQCLLKRISNNIQLINRSLKLISEDAERLVNK